MKRRAALAMACAGVGRWAFAQTVKALPRIGYLIPRSPMPLDKDGFTQGMRELGYVEGANIIIERRHAMGQVDRLPQLAMDLARLPVDVLVVSGPAPLHAAISATRQIPIVMLASSADPVGEGLVASLARPGGNLTGLTYAESPDRFGKQLELLKEAVPDIARVAIWWDSDLVAYRSNWATPLSDAARRLGVQILAPTPALGPEDLDGSFHAMRQQRPDSLFVAINGPSASFLDRVAERALRDRLPTVAAQRVFTQLGGLLSYGPDIPSIHRRGATYVDRILKGARAAELPIELPSRFELVVNQKTARTLSITLPRVLLLRADEVIE